VITNEARAGSIVSKTEEEIWVMQMLAYFGKNVFMLNEKILHQSFLYT